MNRPEPLHLITISIKFSSDSMNVTHYLLLVDVRSPSSSEISPFLRSLFLDCGINSECNTYSSVYNSGFRKMSKHKILKSLLTECVTCSADIVSENENWQLSSKIVIRSN